MNTLLASFSLNDSLPLVASVAIGAGLSLAGWLIQRVLRSEDLEQGTEWRYDVSRINELRRIDRFYRVFQPAVAGLAKLNRTLFRDNLAEVQRELQAAGLPRFWLAEEYLARAELIAAFCSPIYLYFFLGWFGGIGILFAGVVVLLQVWFLRFRLGRRAKARLHVIKRRMPFLLDLLTLLMEAGSTFLNSLSQAVNEFRDHPVGEEFGRVLTDMHMGKTRAEAFQAMRDRLSDDEITSIIGSILQGEQLGTPLAQLFRTQSDVQRIKRTQRAETVAGEAGVNMLLPGVLIMISTVLIIVGPFLLNYLSFGMSM
ncbi:MAG: type II secretion system F family protein [Pirellulales bacterium]|nr:type II secretion system F family protein [Pirellulales bacterium]